MATRWLLVFLGFYGTILLVGCEADEGQTPSPVTESIETLSTDLKAGKPSARVLERYGIFFPDGVKHSISMNEIYDGGPGIDGIAALTHPRFIPAGAADYMEDNDQVLGIARDGESRAYPLRILVNHEIVNDTLGGRPVLVTFCPECGTGIAFDPTVDGKATEFGVSGTLYKRNLLMYDRGSDTPSLWLQASGEAVVGPKTGISLDRVPMTQAPWSEWKVAHPNTTVLSKETGHGYSYIPYPDILDQLPRQILGVIVGDEQKAYFFKDLRQIQVINDAIDGVPIVLIASPDSDAVRVYKRKNYQFEGTFEQVRDSRNQTVWELSEEILLNPKTGESLERVPDVFVSNAGAWARFFPDTLIYQKP